MRGTELFDLKRFATDPWLVASFFNESEMPRPSECAGLCTLPVLDTAGIVRQGDFLTIAAPSVQLSKT
jgi:hypothetical protein